jgi:hypothetical protein
MRSVFPGPFLCLAANAPPGAAFAAAREQGWLPKGAADAVPAAAASGPSSANLDLGFDWSDL